MNAASGERVDGMRRYRFGVKHTSGTWRADTAWRRSTWKYCAAVVGYTTRRLPSADSVR